MSANDNSAPTLIGKQGSSKGAIYPFVKQTQDGKSHGVSPPYYAPYNNDTITPDRLSHSQPIRVT